MRSNTGALPTPVFITLRRNDEKQGIMSDALLLVYEKGLAAKAKSTIESVGAIINRPLADDTRRKIRRM